MFNTSRVIAAAIVTAATLVIPVQSSAADPDAGTAVVITGDDYYVSADSVTVRHNPTRHSAVVEIAHRGDALTVHRTHVADVETGSFGARWWLEATNRRTGAHGYIPQDHLAPKPTVVKPEITEPDTTKPTVVKPEITEPDTTKPTVVKPDIAEPDTKQPTIAEPDTTEAEITKPQSDDPTTTQPETETPGIAGPQPLAPPRP